MATARKSKAAAGKRKAPKRPAARKSVKPAARKSVKPAARKSVKPAARKAAKPAARKPAARAKGAAAAARAPGGKARPAVKAAPRPGTKAPARGRVLRAVARPATPSPSVRPLGVLPPESRARSSDRYVPAARPTPAPSRKAPARAAATGAVAGTAPAATAERLTEKDYPAFEERLHQELQKIRKEMNHLENTVLKVNPRDSSGDLSGYSFHMADAGTDAMEREKAFMFASSEGRMELEIRAALRRIYDGTYGSCELCGEPIARARLEAVPYARLCVPCKQKEEQAGRGQGQPG